MVKVRRLGRKPTAFFFFEVDIARPMWTDFISIHPRTAEASVRIRRDAYLFRCVPERGKATESGFVSVGFETSQGDSRGSSIYPADEMEHGGGCGRKLSPAVLAQILSKMPVAAGVERLLVGTETLDGAAVYQINERQAIV